MSDEWIAAENFERMQELIVAVNALSMHTKLALAGIDNVLHSEDTAQARATLHTFLDRFTSIVTEVERTRGSVVTGIDPRLHQLVTYFVAQRRRLPSRSILYSLPLDELRTLLDATSPDDMERLIACLRELRAVLEQQLHADMSGLLGEI